MLREFLIETGLLNALLEPLIMLIVPPLIGWFSYRWSRLTGHELEQHYRDSLHKAAENAVKVGLRRATSAGIFGRQGEDYALNEAVSYLGRFNPKTVKKFKLSPDDLRALAEAHLPDPRR